MSLDALFDGLFVHDLPEPKKTRRAHKKPVIPITQPRPRKPPIEERLFKTKKDARKTIAKDYKELGSLKALAEKYNSNVNTMSYMLDRLKIKKHPQGGTNRKRSVYTYKGKPRTLESLSKKSGLPHNTIWTRIHRNGWTVERAVDTPRYSNTLYSYRGGKYSIHELSKLSGVKWTTINSRIHAGWSVERAVDTPVPPHLANRRRGERKPKKELDRHDDT